ncbi:bifunctional diaminohydroxyphosphoribosylaminopyrimidine deaminase/5-amino-6-(5-phosphoribosylamino)uracil reductase RibD [Desulfovibrio sp.]|uniref:bifunctional diaminohydroxyphosphoribosylaminopyrimidine deaminase/5-amino-6-(5-phosphoribosylamino)uracil reductase RibD n=1 Tax=Desulfovibrio sp. TaxID=885 RepID=UPI0023C52A66|nr:bifunctional diaminohydroxyphosphoribosylaminopyrimidine deaminase/5-amino-6-(5-phosphoribosylamino)uracil reductase RibD [Desulfovibrio sp.]MDE7240566.1 bifunctional diaminohydroxyphosphoribosylaminopyrimidine deaminase/5-amino-6-(5-phosphoribosylamino)uracil reductase RibD [Desulfovibrio sp.]
MNAVNAEKEREFAPFMREAIALARRGRWRTAPNPMVGAVLVREGEIVARGWHHGAGLPHAEVECLKDAAERGVDPASCTLVVTLEPCCHHGKTPPCTDAIRAAGIRRVVYGFRDPNPVAGGGAALLADAGVEVIGPVLEDECRDLVADFLVWQTTDRPYVLLKLAATLDGRIATRNGISQWISGPESRRKVHGLRAGVGRAGGAVLVGGGTFRADDPQLTARDVPGEDAPLRQPLACVITSRLPAPDGARLVRERPKETVFFVTPAEALRKIGVRVFALGASPGGVPHFSTMLRILRQELGCLYALCEGGGYLALGLLEAGFVDEFHLHVAPLILGDAEARPLFAGRMPLDLEEGLRLRLCGLERCGEDAHLLLRPRLDCGGGN